MIHHFTMRDAFQVLVCATFTAIVHCQSCGPTNKADGCLCYFNDDDDGDITCVSGCCYNNICRSSVDCSRWRIWGGILFFCCVFTTCFLFWYYLMRSQKNHTPHPQGTAMSGGAPPAYAAAVPVYATGGQSSQDGALRETLLQDDGVGMLNVSCPNPSCGLLLSFPTSACGGDVICGVCQARFPLLGVGSESST